MTHDNTETVVHLEDPPNPDLGDLQQRDVFTLPDVPVRVVGTVQVTQVPAKAGPSVIHRFHSGSPTFADQVLGRDLRRSRAVLVCDTAWTYGTAQDKVTLPWPANVPLIITHADEMWAKGTDLKVLAVVTEQYGD